MRCHIYHKSVGVLAALYLLASCGGGAEEAVAPMQYSTVTLAPVDRNLQVRYPAMLQGRQNVEIRPQCSGLITEICIDEGASVRKGQTLFIIEQAPYLAALKTASANVAQAEARLATARLVLEGREMLFRENVVSEYDRQMAVNDLKVAEATLEQMQAQYSNALTELSYTEVKSPVDGVAGMIPWRVGALVDRNIAEPLVCVSDTEEMFAYFHVPETDVLTVGTGLAGLKVSFLPAGGQVPSVEGVIDAVSGTVDARTGTVGVRARIPNHGGLLHDGGTGTVIVSSERQDCLVIPQAATYEIQNRTFVYRMEDGKAVSVPVTVENTGNGLEYIVTSGLEAGDEILSTTPSR